MNDGNASPPTTVITRSGPEDRTPEYRFSSPELVLVEAPEVHVWFDGTHFVEDEHWVIQEGQHFLVTDPGMGTVVSKISSVSESTDAVTVEHLLNWNDDTLRFPDETEEWTREQITGDHDRAMGDASNIVFLRET